LNGFAVGGGGLVRDLRRGKKRGGGFGWLLSEKSQPQGEKTEGGRGNVGGLKRLESAVRRGGCCPKRSHLSRIEDHSRGRNLPARGGWKRGGVIAFRRGGNSLESPATDVDFEHVPERSRFRLPDVTQKPAHGDRGGKGTSVIACLKQRPSP